MNTTEQTARQPIFDVQDCIMTLRGEAVKNNPDKFPEGYVFRIDRQDVTSLRPKFSTSSWGGTRHLPTAFTEKGLYMLATILKRNDIIYV